MTDTDVVIVGGGVMGLFTASYASEHGRRHRHHVRLGSDRDGRKPARAPMT